MSKRSCANGQHLRGYSSPYRHHIQLFCARHVCWCPPHAGLSLGIWLHGCGCPVCSFWPPSVLSVLVSSVMRHVLLAVFLVLLLRVPLLFVRSFWCSELFPLCFLAWSHRSSSVFFSITPLMPLFILSSSNTSLLFVINQTDAALVFLVLLLFLSISYRNPIPPYFPSRPVQRCCLSTTPLIPIFIFSSSNTAPLSVMIHAYAALLSFYHSSQASFYCIVNQYPAPFRHDPGLRSARVVHPRVAVPLGTQAMVQEGVITGCKYTTGGAILLLRPKDVGASVLRRQYSSACKLGFVSCKRKTSSLTAGYSGEMIVLLS